jgi:hypothetical protein
MRKLTQNVLWMNPYISQDLNAVRLRGSCNCNLWAYPLATIHLCGRRRASRGKEFLQGQKQSKSVGNNLSTKIFFTGLIPSKEMKKSRKQIRK